MNYKQVFTDGLSKNDKRSIGSVHSNKGGRDSEGKDIKRDTLDINNVLLLWISEGFI